jgi:RimJ/RimL family protein N-acetyltransferase
MEEARDDDWIGAAVFDIVVRYADSVAAPDGVAPADRGVFADGISLAPLNRSHSTGYYRLALHPDVWRLADASPLLTPTDAEERIVEIEADRNQLASAILHDQAGFIGAVSTDTSSEPAMLSYWIGRPFWNRGAASRAVALHLAYLAALGIQRVQASVFCGNEPSIRVLRRCSFVPLAGTLRQDGAVTRFGAKLAPTR